MNIFILIILHPKILDKFLGHFFSFGIDEVAVKPFARNSNSNMAILPMHIHW